MREGDSDETLDLEGAGEKLEPLQDEAIDTEPGTETRAEPGTAVEHVAVEVDPTPSWSVRARRRLSRGGVIAAVIASLAVVVFTGGVAAGWALATQIIVANVAHPDPEVVQVPLSTVSDDVLMPDVRGLDPDSALQVLADAGVDVATVVTTERAAAGQSGVVIEQLPTFGTPAPTAVDLVVSAPAEVPDLVGRSEQDAMVALRELSARVDRVGVFRPGERVGTVIGVDPPAGSVLPEGVTLTVTEAPAAVDLGALDSSGSCGASAAVAIDGTSFASGVTCPATTSGRSSAWDLDGAVQIVTGIVGIPDNETADGAVRVEFLADGVAVAGYELTPGSSETFELRIDGVRRFEVRCTALGGTSTSVAIGRFQGLGTAAAVDGLSR